MKNRLLFLMLFSMMAMFAFAQGRSIKGTVLDPNNEAIIGANVLVEGTTNGTITDLGGNFTLNGVPTNAKLKVTYIGYISQTVPVSGKTTLQIILKEDAQSLDEVVVVGYGVQKKSDVTGALARVGEKEMKAMPVQNALQAMQGKTAGVDITSNERPGEMGSIRIRGERSLKATNGPLYVVDGIPLQGTGIENINPSDIESIDVLKDASATAIYGSRGANGVIIVSTKRGKSGKLTLNYSGTVSIENMHDRVEMMNAAEWIDFSRAAKIRSNTYNKSTVISYDNDKKVFGNDPVAWANFEKGWVNGEWDGSRVNTYDWTKEGLQTALTHEHTLSASGGTEKMQAYASFGFLNQEGTQPGQGYQRYTAKTSVDLTPVDWFKLGASINVTYGDQDYGYNFRKSVTGASNLYFALQGMLPWTQPYDDNGAYIRNPGGDVNIINPIRETSLCLNQRENLRAFGSFYAELNIGEMIPVLDGLKYRMNFGPDFRYGRTGIADSNQSINGDGNNVGQYSTEIKRSWTIDNLIYYNKTVKKHSLGFTLLQSASAYHMENSSIKAFVNSDEELWYNLNSAGNIQNAGTGLVETQMESYMIRANYGFADKYLMTVSGRWDGASMLADGHKWDFFPSLALGWRMDREAFMQKLTWVEQLKLRFGVGTTGNSAIDAYATKGSVNSNFYHFGDAILSGMVPCDPSAKDPIVMANRKLGWEKTTQYNLGVDFSVLNGRIGGSVDIYKSKTSDLLMTKSLPSLTGYLAIWDNIGKTENKGIDISINTVNIQTNNFSWSSALTFSADRSKVTELSNGKTEDIQNNWFVGQPIGTYYDYQYDGIWKSSEKDEAAKYGRTPGMIKIKDINGPEGVPDGKIDANYDRTFVGSARPDWSGGFLNTFSYRNWELSCFLYGRFGFTVRSGAETLSGRFAMRKLDYWVEGTNEDAQYYAPGVNGESGDTYKNAMNYQDGSFIKLRNVSLGYNFTKRQLGKTGLSNLKLYAQCMNPGLLYSKVDYIDPDLGGSTYNRGFVFGINIGF
ncbi:MAG: TonB-dependent receptor [Bacteroides sp.]|uniref:SusC/RagA family TonB-linked outer membrane protein n=3 Tax=Bacteroides sp. TaxID=29523 RepID=UPI001B560709|nr:TonB-dependent receptor [Bacteroides sp.]MBP6066075.1 TonB-dependent receptor [Bacteroides sp.]MBP6068271.1 TonB-dependent receptor [Bacteroides sp.]MBP9586599.1 TonB-dependent receptor [Bacteroides sp.]